MGELKVQPHCSPKPPQCQAMGTPTRPGFTLLVGLRCSPAYLSTQGPSSPRLDFQGNPSTSSLLFGLFKMLTVGERPLSPQAYGSQHNSSPQKPDMETSPRRRGLPSSHLSFLGSSHLLSPSHRASGPAVDGLGLPSRAVGGPELAWIFRFLLHHHWPFPVFGVEDPRAGDAGDGPW